MAWTLHVVTTKWGVLACAQHSCKRTLGRIRVAHGSVLWVARDPLSGMAFFVISPGDWRHQVPDFFQNALPQVAKCFKNEGAFYGIVGSAPFGE